jgi:hypothetical protein
MTAMAQISHWTGVRREDIGADYGTAPAMMN